MLELPLLVTMPIVLDPGMLTLYVAPFLILSTPCYVVTPQLCHYSTISQYLVRVTSIGNHAYCS